MFRGAGYRFLEGLAIGGRGRVSSVQVFLRRPLARLGSIALDPASRTAQALSQVTLARRAPGTRFVDVAAGADPRAIAARGDLGGWLRIGDTALRECAAPGAPETFNPSQAWLEDTGLSFAFAVWLVRPGAEISREHARAFAAARARGTPATARIADDAAAALALPRDFCRRYLLEECRYELGPELDRTLRAFRDAAAELALCRRDLEPGAIALG
jgi:predicted solute-binding protein